MSRASLAAAVAAADNAEAPAVISAAPPEDLMKKGEEVARKHKAFIAKSREDLTRAQKEKQQLATRLKSMQRAAIMRRQREQLNQGS